MSAERIEWYNSSLDPAYLHKMTEPMKEAVDTNEYGQAGDLVEPAPDGEHGQANLISSLCSDGLHRLAVDIDGMNVEVRPSCTPGHYHLLIDHPGIELDEYIELLEALAMAGIIEESYLDHSVDRGQSLLRKPGVPRIFKRPGVEQ